MFRPFAAVLCGALAVSAMRGPPVRSFRDDGGDGLAEIKYTDDTLDGGKPQWVFRLGDKDASSDEPSDPSDERPGHTHNYHHGEEPVATIFEILGSNPMFSRVFQLVKSSEEMITLFNDSSVNITFFAPSNWALDSHSHNSLKAEKHEGPHKHIHPHHHKDESEKNPSLSKAEERMEKSKIPKDADDEVAVHPKRHHENRVTERSQHTEGRHIDEHESHNHPDLLYSTLATLLDVVDSPSEFDLAKPDLSKVILWILQYHTLPSALSTKDLKENTTYPTSLVLKDGSLDSEALRLRVEDCSVNMYAKLGKKNIRATNGFIHEVDHPLIPPATIFEDLFLFPNKFSTLTSALSRVGLANALDLPAWTESKDASSLTFFAPTNKAFEKLPEDLQFYLFTPVGEKALRKLLQLHVVPDFVLHSDWIHSVTNTEEVESHPEAGLYDADAKLKYQAYATTDEHRKGHFGQGKHHHKYDKKLHGEHGPQIGSESEFHHSAREGFVHAQDADRSEYRGPSHFTKLHPGPHDEERSCFRKDDAEHVPHKPHHREKEFYGHGQVHELSSHRDDAEDVPYKPYHHDEEFHGHGHALSHHGKPKESSPDTAFHKDDSEHLPHHRHINGSDELHHDEQETAALHNDDAEHVPHERHHHKGVTGHSHHESHRDEEFQVHDAACHDKSNATVYPGDDAEHVPHKYHHEKEYHGHAHDSTHQDKPEKHSPPHKRFHQDMPERPSPDVIHRHSESYEEFSDVHHPRPPMDDSHRPWFMGPRPNQMLRPPHDFHQMHRENFGVDDDEPHLPPPEHERPYHHKAHELHSPPVYTLDITLPTLLKGHSLDVHVVQFKHEAPELDAKHPRRHAKYHKAITVNGQKVKVNDIVTRNGALHVVDELLHPFGRNETAVAQEEGVHKKRDSHDGWEDWEDWLPLWANED